MTGPLPGRDRGGGGGSLGFVVETAGMNKKMEGAREGNVILPCLAHVKS